MGGPPMGGGDPLMGGIGGPPPMGGGDPMGGMGGHPPPMGGDPMGGMGGPPPMGGMGAPQNPALPQEKDVWSVLDAILNNKPLKEEKPKAAAPPPLPAPPMGDPMGIQGGPPMMGGPNPPSPMGADPLQSAPHLMQ